MLNLRMAAFGALAAIGLALPASATTVVDFSGPWEYTKETDPYAFGTTSLTVSADTFRRLSLDPLVIELHDRNSAHVTINQEGLGVDNDGRWYNCRRDCDGDVDGAGRNDILLFAFDEQIELTEINFDNVSSDDQFVFFAFDTLAELSGSIAALFLDITDLHADEGIYTFSPAATGRYFGIGAIQTNDDFRVEGLTGTVVAVVPLPPALPLFLGALFGFGILARRRS